MNYEISYPNLTIMIMKKNVVNALILTIVFGVLSFDTTSIANFV